MNADVTMTAIRCRLPTSRHAWPADRRSAFSHTDVLFEWWYRVRDGTLARSTLRMYVGALRSAFRDDLERGAE